MRVDRTVVEIWTIYDRPLDFPEGFIARRFEVVPGSARPTTEALTGTLANLRREMERQGRVCLPRDPGDHPNVVESWI